MTICCILDLLVRGDLSLDGKSQEEAETGNPPKCHCVVVLVFPQRQGTTVQVVSNASQCRPGRVEF